MKKIISALMVATLVTSSSIAKDWMGNNNTRFVHVSDVNNSANTDNKLGSVSYDYSIAKMEVSNGQYVKFMNSVGSNTVNVNGTSVKLYGGFDASSTYSKFSLISQNESGNSFTANEGKENYAVNFMSAYGIAMYCNWLTNGAPETSTADTYLTGAYNLKEFGASVDIFKESNINANGTYRLPTADEWYKAAFYNPENDSYFDYAVGDTISTDMANYSNRNGGTSNVAQYEMYSSAYETINQNGNVAEWIVTSMSEDPILGTMGGAFYSTVYALKSSASIVNQSPDSLTGRANGFRISYSVSTVPEPATYAMLVGATALGLAIWRKR